MFLNQFFKIEENETSLWTEFIAGATTFAAMSYIVAVIPGMLSHGGDIPFIPAVTATLLLTVVTSLAMGLYTNRPFVLGPGLGSVAIVSFTILGNGVPVSVAMGIVFLGGAIFMAISFLGVRDFVVRIVPQSVKVAVSVGIGLFIALLGFKESGIVIADASKNELVFGNLTSIDSLLSVLGIILILIFSTRQIKGGLIISIIIITLIGIPLGVTDVPEKFVSLPTGLSDMSFKLDVLSALKLQYVPFLLALFIPDFFSTLGTVLGVGGRAGFLDSNGDLPEIEKTFYVDSTATTLGSLFSVPTMTTYLESSAGVETGGRTGLTAVVAAIFFAIMLFFSPVAGMIPSAATAPVLIYIGISMFGGMRSVNYADFNEYFPAFTCIVLTIFTFNVGNGIAAALLVRGIAQISSGRLKEDHWAFYLIALLMVGYFVVIANNVV